MNRVQPFAKLLRRMTILLEDDVLCRRTCFHPSMRHIEFEVSWEDGAGVERSNGRGWDGVCLNMSRGSWEL